MRLIMGVILFRPAAYEECSSSPRCSCSDKDVYEHTHLLSTHETRTKPRVWIVRRTNPGSFAMSPAWLWALFEFLNLGLWPLNIFWPSNPDQRILTTKSWPLNYSQPEPYYLQTLTSEPSSSPELVIESFMGPESLQRGISLTLSLNPETWALET